MRQLMATVLDETVESMYAAQRHALTGGDIVRPRWPMIVLRSPKGWTGPKEVDGLQIEGTFRSHQVPVADVKDKPEHLQILEQWMRGYHPEELFDNNARLIPELAALAPAGERRMGANPHANGGKLMVELDIPSFTDYAVEVQKPATVQKESTRQLGMMLRDIFTRNAEQRNFRLFCPDETNSNRLTNVFEVENRTFVEPIYATDDHLSPDGRVMEVLSEHLCHGWLEGYLLTGRHGIFATYESFALVSASMTVQHTKWMEEGIKLPWRAPISSLNILLTSTCWRNDHNGFSHQGPGLIDTVLSKKGTVARIYLPPDANCLLSVADHCLRSRDYVTLIVIDKQPQLQWLDIEPRRQHAAEGASVWDWAGNDQRGDPDIVLAGAGDIVTMETLAAADLLRQYVPALEFRVVNVLDLMALFPEDRHPHGMDEGHFVDLFTADTDVVFAFHGYPSAVHHLIHGRPDPGRFHVRGYEEEGTTTTPFDMVVRNHVSRYDLCMEALRRVRRAPVGGETLVEHCEDMLRRHHAYIVE